MILRGFQGLFLRAAQLLPGSLSRYIPLERGNHQARETAEDSGVRQKDAYRDPAVPTLAAHVFPAHVPDI